ncbi:manganese resistance protein mnr2 [Lentinula edodes]|uniref:Manganese resistance protein mnr2 n=2 Tax=Lentinula TaxID=5352 RepID=A0A1Q3E0V6_LENED|nr:manganese resistance protein mnr2 [Lentinula edodes]
MSSGGVLSSSPVSTRGGSPVRRKGSSSISVDDSENRPRLSPTLARSFDPNDPQVRERQQTLDMDMAMQLSKARRDTITTSPTTTHQEIQAESQDVVAQAGLSPREQRDIDIAQGPSMEEIDDLESIITKRQPSPVDLRDLLPQSHDPSLLVSLNDAVHPSADRDDPSTSAYGVLPTYQANMSQSAFNFAPMEVFAASERLKLGITSPSNNTTKFNLPPPRNRQNTDDVFFPSGETIDSALSDSAAASSSTPIRQPTIPATQYPSVPGLNAGHDRPYRFSFYSNALPSTIHARSLSEIPAEGQTFEDLFAGINRDRNDPNAKDKDKRPTSAGPKGYFPGNVKPTYRSRPGFGGGLGFSSYEGADPESCTWWLDVLSPTDEEMTMLSKAFGIHPLTTEDIQMEETREKIELFRNYYLVCFRSFDQDSYSPTYLEPLNMYIIVFREGTLSFHFRPTPHPSSVRRRIKQLKDYISVTSDWISYALIDDITDAFGPLIQSIEYEVDSIDELVLILKDSTEQSDMLRRIGTCRKKVMGLLRLMGNKADVVKGLAKRCNENWQVAPTSDIGLYLSDIQDHLITMTQSLNHYEKILSRSHSNYLAQISIEMTEANNQINDVLSKLTALGTVLIPMNLVTGLWGMNVHVPGEDAPGYAWFVSIIACLAAFAVIGGYTTYRLMSRR